MKIVVAMSGGVDSATVAGLLVEQGHDVIGLHMKLHAEAPAAAGSRTCCGLDDALDARAVAAHLRIPFYVLDLQEAFHRSVVAPFVEAWVAGRTPSPCVHCNGVLKFRVLLGRALALGATHLATGHYARVGEGPTLRVAADPAKDQSYFLFPLTRAGLEHVLFPLGGLTKAEVRGHAARLGLPVAEKPESQDVCFLPDHDHAGLVRRARPDIDAAGEIVHEDGTVLGRHDGYFRFTVGQRRGLGVAAPEALYVTRIDPASRRVVVGPVDRLGASGLVADGCTFAGPPPVDRVVGARIRHRGPLHAATVDVADDGAVRVRFLAPARAVSPGQAVVFYEDGTVLGGGWIREAIAA